MTALSIQRLSEILQGNLRLSDVPPAGGLEAEVGPVAIDLRQVTDGGLFWDLGSPGADKARRLEEAYCRGAAGAVVSRDRYRPRGARYLIEVDDPRWALWQLARWQRSQFAGRMVAVTGSIGKTTTARMIQTVLRAQFRGTSSGELNDSACLPASMLAIQADDEFAVLELANQQRGQLDALASLARPQIGVIMGTGAESSHRLRESIGQFAPEPQFSELADALPDGGTLILDGDDPAFRRLEVSRDRIRVVRVGRSSHCDLVASHVSSGDGWLNCQCERTTLHVPVWGRHPLNSVLAAYAVGRTMNLPPESIADALTRFRPLPGRCAVMKTERATVIDDTYDGRLESFRVALTLLRDCGGPTRRIAVCGDLESAGAEDNSVHQELGRWLVTHGGADVLVACGQRAESLLTAARIAGMPPRSCINAGDDLAATVTGLMEPGDAVLLKGRHPANIRELARQFNGEAADAGRAGNASETNTRSHTLDGQSRPAATGQAMPILEVPPFVSVLRETNTTLPPG